jgi:uncharacterized membrane protein YgdD (TMEM256/DUF423 family)
MSHFLMSDVEASNTRYLPISARLFGGLGALSACTSVILSAAFAHLPVFAEGVPTVVQTALNQQQFHALGLILTALSIVVCGTSRWLQAAGWLMLVGSVLFSLNVYARHVFGVDTFRAQVPWGGGAWVAAWLCLAVGVVIKKPIGRRDV